MRASSERMKEISELGYGIQDRTVSTKDSMDKTLQYARNSAKISTIIAVQTKTLLENMKNVTDLSSNNKISIHDSNKVIESIVDTTKVLSRELNEFKS